MRGRRSAGPARPGRPGCDDEGDFRVSRRPSEGPGRYDLTDDGPSRGRGRGRVSQGSRSPNTGENRMNTTHIRSSRRAFLGTLALGATAFTARGAFAEELTRTPTTNEGPFYPTKLPLDTDNDLLDHQRRDHPRRRRGHAPRRPAPRRQGGPDPQRRHRDLAVRQGRHLPQAAHAGRGQVRHELPGIRPLPDRLDRRVLLPDDQAGPLPGPPRGAHPRAGLEGGQEAAHDRVLHQGLPGQRAGRAVQADPGPRPQGPRDPLPGLRPGQGLEDRRAGRAVGHRPGIQPRSLSQPSAEVTNSPVSLLERHP